MLDGREPAQVVADPLTIPLRRPAGGKVRGERVFSGTVLSLALATTEATGKVGRTVPKMRPSVMLFQALMLLP